MISIPAPEGMVFYYEGDDIAPTRYVIKEVSYDPANRLTYIISYDQDNPEGGDFIDYEEDLLRCLNGGEAKWVDEA